MTKLDSLGRTRPPIQCSDAPTFSFNVFGSDGSKQLAALYGPTSAPAFSPNHLRKIAAALRRELGPVSRDSLGDVEHLPTRLQCGQVTGQMTY